MKEFEATQRSFHPFAGFECHPDCERFIHLIRAIVMFKQDRALPSMLAQLYQLTIVQNTTERRFIISLLSSIQGVLETSLLKKKERKQSPLSKIVQYFLTISRQMFQK